MERSYCLAAKASNRSRIAKLAVWFGELMDQRFISFTNLVIISDPSICLARKIKAAASDSSWRPKCDHAVVSKG